MFPRPFFLTIWGPSSSGEWAGKGIREDQPPGPAAPGAPRSACGWWEVGAGSGSAGGVGQRRACARGCPAAGPAPPLRSCPRALCEPRCQPWEEPRGRGDVPAALCWPRPWPQQLRGAAGIRAVEKPSRGVGVQAAASRPAPAPLRPRSARRRAPSSLRLPFALSTLRLCTRFKLSVKYLPALRLRTFFVVASRRVRVTGSILLFFKQINVLSRSDTEEKGFIGESGE